MRIRTALIFLGLSAISLGSSSVHAQESVADDLMFCLRAIDAGSKKNTAKDCYSHAIATLLEQVRQEDKELSNAAAEDLKPLVLASKSAWELSYEKQLALEESIQTASSDQTLLYARTMMLQQRLIQLATLYKLARQ